MIWSSEGLLNRKSGFSAGSLHPKVEDISAQYWGMRSFSPLTMLSVNLALGPVTAIVQRILPSFPTIGPAIEEKPSWYSLMQ